MLPITGIKRHPDFDIIRGNNTSQYVENDVAVIFVNDEILKNLTISSKINPACLPSATTYPTNNQETRVLNEFFRNGKVYFVKNNRVTLLRGMPQEILCLLLLKYR